MSVFIFFLYIVLFFTALPICILAIETVAAILITHPHQPAQAKSMRIAVIIPAHNEATVIAPTIRSIQPQLRKTDNMLVVADNCNDATSSIAARMGVDVIKRFNSLQIGKGYALDTAVSALTKSPPDVVVFMDADVLAEQNSIQTLAATAVHTGRPVQAVYLLKAADSGKLAGRLAEFAFYFKNYIRPLGLFKLGLPCLLTGTGMAIPWQLIQKVQLASSNIVEDMQLGIDLAVAGYSPLFCPEARITGEFPSSPDAAAMQWKRWGYGHLSTIFKQVPGLLCQSIKQRRIDLLGLGIELLIPPLSLLTCFWFMLMLIVILFRQFAPVPWFLTTAAAGSGILLAISILLGRHFFCRHIIPFRMLLAAPLYAIFKLPAYWRFITHPEKKWHKTSREKHSMNQNNKSKLSR